MVCACVMSCMRVCVCLPTRYRVKDYLGSAAFSTALSCEDLHTGMDVCLKVRATRQTVCFVMLIPQSFVCTHLVLLAAFMVESCIVSPVHHAPPHLDACPQ